MLNCNGWPSVDLYDVQTDLAYHKSVAKVFQRRSISLLLFVHVLCFKAPMIWLICNTMMCWTFFFVHFSLFLLCVVAFPFSVRFTFLITSFFSSMQQRLPSHTDSTNHNSTTQRIKRSWLVVGLNKIRRIIMLNTLKQKLTMQEFDKIAGDWYELFNRWLVVRSFPVFRRWNRWDSIRSGK